METKLFLWPSLPTGLTVSLHLCVVSCICGTPPPALLFRLFLMKSTTPFVFPFPLTPHKSYVGQEME